MKKYLLIGLIATSICNLAGCLARSPSGGLAGGQPDEAREPTRSQDSGPKTGGSGTSGLNQEPQVVDIEVPVVLGQPDIKVLPSWTSALNARLKEKALPYRIELKVMEPDEVDAKVPVALQTLSLGGGNFAQQFKKVEAKFKQIQVRNERMATLVFEVGLSHPTGPFPKNALPFAYLDDEVNSSDENKNSFDSLIDFFQNKGIFSGAGSGSASPKPNPAPKSAAQIVDIEVPVVLGQAVGKVIPSWTLLLNERLQEKGFNYRITTNIVEPDAVASDAPILFRAIALGGGRLAARLMNAKPKFDRIQVPQDRIATIVFSLGVSLPSDQVFPDDSPAFACDIDQVHSSDENRASFDRIIKFLKTKDVIK